MVAARVAFGVPKACAKWFGDLLRAVPREKNLHFQPEALN
jgi:hypothetical protein